QPLRVEGVAVRRVVDGPAVEAVQLRLGVEALDVTDAAAQENPDDVAGARREVRPAVRQRVVGGAGDAVAEQQRAQGQAGEAHAGVGQEGAAGDPLAAVRRWVRGHRKLPYNS